MYVLVCDLDGDGDLDFASIDAKGRYNTKTIVYYENVGDASNPNFIQECQTTCANDPKCLAFTIKQTLGSCTYFCTSTDSDLCDTNNALGESTYDGTCYDTTNAKQKGKKNWIEGYKKNCKNKK